jgi:AAA15 family ATPase/GTPase
MLIQFSVSNFRSFKDTAILSLSPSATQEHPENIQAIGKDKALRVISIYGANASGKSNLFKAMTTALLMLRASNTLQVTNRFDVPPFNLQPFAFDSDKSKQPSVFEFTFIAMDGKKYVYGFSADATQILEEYLYCYLTAKPTMIFERTDVNQYKFRREDKKALEDIVKRNLPNKLFLATATAWNFTAMQTPYNWLAKYIDTYGDNMVAISGRALEMYENGQQGNLKEFTKSLLQHADINIDDYSMKVNEIPLPIPIQNQPAPGQIPQVLKNYEIRTGHTIVDAESKPVHYELNMGEESLGTQQLFFFSPILKEAFENGKTIIIDELDKSLHPHIVRFLVSQFLDPSVNTGNAQLIFSTHDTSLLSLDTFRRDEIYFTEKDNSNGASVLYSLDDFQVRKTENIQKGYLLGRYGAIPFLQTEGSLWE